MGLSTYRRGVLKYVHRCYPNQVLHKCIGFADIGFKFFIVVDEHVSLNVSNVASIFHS